MAPAVVGCRRSLPVRSASILSLPARVTAPFLSPEALILPLTLFIEDFVTELKALNALRAPVTLRALIALVVLFSLSAPVATGSVSLKALSPGTWVRL